MRIFLMASVLFLAAVGARAQTATYVNYSSCTYSYALVSSGTWKRRIDNLDHGAVQLMNGRTLVRVTTPTPLDKNVWIGYDTSVSSSPKASTGMYGRQLTTGTVDIPVSSGIPIYAIGEDVLGVSTATLSVEQCKPQRNYGE